MERNLKHLLLRKNVWGNALALKSKKVHCIFKGTFILALLSSYVFLSLENPCILLLAKEKTWKGTFDINRYRKIVFTEKQIMLFLIEKLVFVNKY